MTFRNYILALLGAVTSILFSSCSVTTTTDSKGSTVTTISATGIINAAGGYGECGGGYGRCSPRPVRVNGEYRHYVPMDNYRPQRRPMPCPPPGYGGRPSRPYLGSANRPIVVGGGPAVYAFSDQFPGGRPIAIGR